MTLNPATPQFLVCVSVGKYPASLETHKSYRVIPDESAAGKGFIRVIDESGEDYLYPRRLFATAGVLGTTAIKRVPAGSVTTVHDPRKKPKSRAKFLMTKGLRQQTGVPSGLHGSIREFQHPAQPEGPPLTTPRRRR